MNEFTEIANIMQEYGPRPTLLVQEQLVHFARDQSKIRLQGKWLSLRMQMNLPE